MSFFTAIRYYANIASALAILAAVILFPPNSAHAELRHCENSELQIHQIAECVSHSLKVDKSIQIYELASDGENPHGSSDGCCSTNCVTTILLNHSRVLNHENDDRHISQTYIELASVSVPVFQRPPNL